MNKADKARLKKDNLVKVYWEDIVGAVNEALADTNIVRAVTYGVVQSLDSRQLKMSTSLFCTPLSKDVEGDHTAIPIGTITSVVLLAKNELPWSD